MDCVQLIEREQNVSMADIVTDVWLISQNYKNMVPVGCHVDTFQQPDSLLNRKDSMVISNIINAFSILKKKFRNLIFSQEFFFYITRFSN